MLAFSETHNFLGDMMDVFTEITPVTFSGPMLGKVSLFTGTIHTLK